MADLSQLLSELLNSPDGMEKLQNAAATLGVALPQDDKQENAADADGHNVLSASGGLPDLSALGDISMITKILPLMSDMKNDDEHTRLLKAIKPYLKEDRKERLDQSVKIMRMLKLLPLLKDSGGLGGIF